MKTGKRNIFIRFLFPYMLLLLVTCFMGLYMYNTTLDTVKEDALEVNRAVLAQANLLIEQRLREMEDTVVQMAFNSSLSRCLNMRQPFSSRGSYYLYEAQRSLSLQGLANNFIPEYYVYLPDGGVVILPSTTYTRPRLFFSQYLDDSGLTYEQWSGAALSSGGHKRYGPRFEMRGVPYIPYTFVLQQGSTGRVQGVITALISTRELDNFLQNMYAGGAGWYFILNRENEVITASPGAPEAQFLPQEAASVNPDGAVWSVERVIDGEPMLLTCARSAQSGWTFTMALPYDTVMGKVENISTSLKIVLVVLLALGLAISLLFTYQNSRPLTKLLARAMEKNGTSRSSTGKNGFSIIEEAMTEAFSSNEDLQKRMDQQMPLLRAGVFDKLCRGAFATEEEIGNALESLQMKPFQGEYVCLVLQFRPEEHAGGGKERRSMEMKKLLAGNLMRENQGQYSVLFESGDAQTMTFLLGFDGKGGALPAQWVYTRVEEAYARLNRFFGQGVMCSVGRIGERLLDVYKSYNDAIRTIEYSENAYTEDRLVWYDDIPANTNSIYYPIELEQRLMLLVKAGKRGEIKPLMEEVFRENRALDGLSRQSIRILLQEMQGTLIKLYGQWGLPPRNAIVAFDDLTDLGADTQDRVEAVFEALADSVEKQKKSHNTELERGVIDYIDQNFQNGALTLNMVAEAFNISETYLSYFFREQTGSTFSRYLENRRIEYAGKLLQQGGMTVYKIAEACGYNSAQSFRRAYKRVKNINPTET